jgi:hypothetical protein
LSGQGDVYRTLNKYEKALADCNKSLKIQPNDAWVLKVIKKQYFLLQPILY